MSDAALAELGELLGIGDEGSADDYGALLRGRGFLRHRPTPKTPASRDASASRFNDGVPGVPGGAPDALAAAFLAARPDEARLVGALSSLGWKGKIRLDNDGSLYKTNLNVSVGDGDGKLIFTGVKCDVAPEMVECTCKRDPANVLCL